MNPVQKTKITIQATIDASIDNVWKCWTNPEDITQWNFASPEWHVPAATNDLKVGGRFSYRMEARDGSFGFDFSGVYDKIDPKKYIEYTLDDGRMVAITFRKDKWKVKLIETFEAETENSVDLQQAGWQAILDNFKKHAEDEI